MKAPVGWLLGIVAFLAQGLAIAGEADLRDVAVAAIHSPSGTAKAELDGQFARFVRTKLKTDSRVFAESRVVRAFKRPDCKRIRTRISAPQAGAPPGFSFTVEMNLCADGTAPLDAPPAPLREELR